MKSNFGLSLVVAVVCFCIGAATAEFSNDLSAAGNVCALYNNVAPDETQAVDECRSPGSGSSDSQPLCFALYRSFPTTEIAEVITRGCWPMIEPECQELSQMNGGKGACATSPFTSGNDSLTLCCCVGPLCNLNLQPKRHRREQPTTRRPPEPPKTAEIQSPVQEHEEPVPMNPWLYALVPCFALVVVGAVVFVKKMTGRYQEFEDDDDLCRKDQGTFKLGEESLFLGEVTLLEEIDRGSFGAVWKGLHKLKPVAVKICSASAQQVCLNEVEVYCLPGMKHPNIVEFLGARQQSDGESKLMEYWIFTTWHEMGNLEDYLRNNTVSRAQLLQLAESIVKGVMQLHSDVLSDGSKKPAVAHRDIKSTNILLKNDHTACIADFGLAIVFDQGEPIGNYRYQAGTPRYMAPEVLENAVSFTAESFQMMDMYAVALVIWEIMTRTEVPSCSLPIPEYKLPYEKYVGIRTSIEEMLLTVVYYNRRPLIKKAWWKDKCLSVLATTLKECWDNDADARLSASLVYGRLRSLICSHTAIEIEDDSGHRSVSPKIEKSTHSPFDLLELCDVHHL